MSLIPVVGMLCALQKSAFQLINFMLTIPPSVIPTSPVAWGRGYIVDGSLKNYCNYLELILPLIIFRMF